MNSLLIKIVPQILQKLPISADQALQLANLPKSANLDLFALAGLAASLSNMHEHLFTCAIVNAKSGRCAENCAFCAQSVHYHTNAPEYPLLDAESLFRHAEKAAQAGVARFGIVTSGMHLTNQELNILCSAAECITQNLKIQLCGSLGQITEAQALRLRSAGFSRLHHNLETAESFFPKICSTHDYAEDLQSLAAIRSAGLEICCGGIFGLGESWQQRIEFSQLLADLQVTAIPINFLTPVPGTPLANMALLHPSEALRIAAILRLMHPARDILVCGGRAAVLGSAWHSWLFAAGANAIMTGNYLTTSGFSFESDRKMLQELGI